MKVIKIELIQNGSVLEFSTNVESQRLDEISGTLSGRIISLMLKSQKYKMNLGFCFKRKFDVKITIDGKEASGTESLMNGVVKFGITLNKVDLFHDFINELVVDLLNGSNELEYTFEEYKELIGLN